MTLPVILSIVAILLSVITLGWQIFNTVRLNDASFTVEPAPVDIFFADGIEPLPITLTNLGSHLVRDVHLQIHSDPMNHSLQLADLVWHGIPAKSSVTTTVQGMRWYDQHRKPQIPWTERPQIPWNERFYGPGMTSADRLVTVSWKDVLGFRRKQVIELPKLPAEPPYATEELAARYADAWQSS